MVDLVGKEMKSKYESNLNQIKSELHKNLDKIYDINDIGLLKHKILESEETSNEKQMLF